MTPAELKGKIQLLPEALQVKLLTLPLDHNGEADFDEAEQSLIVAAFGDNWIQDLGL